VIRIAGDNPVRSLWDRLHGFPGGRRLFGILLGRIAPYTGTISPRVLELREGYAKVMMLDRRAVRNHLRSIHAIALMNLAEVTTGLALLYCLPSTSRAILRGLSIEFVKKARGTLTAEATTTIPVPESEGEVQIETQLRDETGDVVAAATARWLVGPRQEIVSR
jgi:acyl-coenzyme A thioesterase PaaI-like protein